MPSVRSLYHIILVTDEGKETIAAAHQAEVYRYLERTVEQNYCHLHAIGGTPSHVHLLVELDERLTLALLVARLRKDAAVWMRFCRKQFPEWHGWAETYAAFSLSEQERSACMARIAAQSAYHVKASLQEEWRELHRQAGFPETAAPVVFTGLRPSPYDME